MILLSLALIFFELSFLAVGGGNTILPEMQRQVVDVQHWMPAQEFTALFALAQAAPGPNLMLVPLIGWRVDGIAGLMVSSLALFTPSCIMTGVVSIVWRRFRDAGWRKLLQASLIPVTIGLVAASALLIASTADSSLGLAAITIVVAAITLRTRIHPLWLLAGGALAGLAGLA